MSEFVEQPIKKLMNEENPITRIERVEELTGASPSSKVNSMDEVANDMGIFGGGSNELVFTPEGVESVLPTSTDFTGTFVSGDGYEFDSELYNIGGVNAGVLQWGAKQDDGKMKAGAGVVTLDENGIQLLAQNTSPLSFVDDEGGELVTILNGGDSEAASAIPNLIISALQRSGKNSSVSINATSSSGNEPSILLFASESGGASGGLGVYDGIIHVFTSDGSVMRAQSSNVVFNEDGLDMDFRIESDTQANMVLVDAGANKVYLNNIDVTPDASATFTPVIQGTSTAGAGTYSTQTGVYFCMGNIVHFQLQLTWTAHTGTGNIEVGGLPFTSANNGINPACAVFFNNLTLAAVGNKVEAALQANSTTIAIREIGSGATALIPMDTAADLRITGWYIKA